VLDCCEVVDMGTSLRLHLRSSGSHTCWWQFRLHAGCTSCVCRERTVKFCLCGVVLFVQALAGLATGSKAYAECVKLGGGKSNCRATKKGYVTVNQGKDSMACIHTPNGAGICWPGGKTGYNKSIQVTCYSSTFPLARKTGFFWGLSIRTTLRMRVRCGARSWSQAQRQGARERVTLQVRPAKNSLCSE
jgi:hypothetical protein